MTRVLRKITENYENMQKGVERIMGGYIIKTELDIAREEGIEEGEERGQKKLAETVLRLRKGETKEMILKSGIDNETLELALSLV